MIDQADSEQHSISKLVKVNYKAARAYMSQGNPIFAQVCLSWFTASFSMTLSTHVPDFEWCVLSDLEKTEGHAGLLVHMLFIVCSGLVLIFPILVCLRGLEACKQAAVTETEGNTFHSIQTADSFYPLGWSFSDSFSFSM